MKRDDDKILKGMSVYPGVAWGEIFTHKGLDLDALRNEKFEVKDTDEELARLDRAVAKSLRQLRGLREKIESEDKGSIKDIFDAQAMMLKDPGFLDGIRESINTQEVNIEYVISNEIDKIEKDFDSIKEESLKERFKDIQDTYNRLLRNVLDLEHVMTNPLERLDNPAIMVAKDVLPSDIAGLDRQKIKGFAVQKGSRTSHAAIIAKTMGLPAVIRIPGLMESIGECRNMLVDGVKGEIILNPSEQEIEERGKTVIKKKESLVRKFSGIPCETAQGKRIFLKANIGTLEEARIARENGADGVGLLRSEFFYMSRGSIPEPSEETAFYKEILNVFSGLPVTFRLLDIGSDKKIPDLPYHNESNPQMGIRGIRYLLKYPEIMRRQIGCLMTASRGTEELRILLPFVTTKEDVDRATKIIKVSADKKGFDLNKLKIGIMAEVPSVALDIEKYLNGTDFISIGTNDLTQYMFAVSREDTGLDTYRESSGPLMLRIIKGIIRAAARADMTVDICGEIAGEPDDVPSLIEAGAGHLSMSPQLIPGVKEKIMESC
ncbi:MAG: phosphoenolpyruvate--protein phosphotransferase [Candidatus Brocadiia bacterium]